MARDGKTSRPGSTVAVEEGAPLFCPSAQPGMRDPVVIGVVEQDGAQDRRIAYLEQAIPYDEKVAALSGAVDPGKVMRIAARCEETRCAHFDGSRCSLVSRIRDLLPEAAVKAPPCAIRSACRWFAEQGAAACLRCERITTSVGPEQVRADSRIRQAATPPPL